MVKPFIGQDFEVDAVEFYRKYAGNCGFDIRLSTTKKSRHGYIYWRAVVCNRQGEIYTSPDGNEDGEKKKRFRVSKRVDCHAHFVIIFNDVDGYVVKHLKVANECALPNTRHRLCMKHIMLKVPDKVPVHLKKDDSFRSDINSAIWSETIKPDVFKAKWNAMMVSYGLEHDDWFTSMYEIHHLWIPAYFRDFSMSGLFKTTSMSESVNSFFGSYTSPHLNLLEFYSHFETAVEAQRHAFDQLTSEDESCIPQLKTPHSFEQQAVCVYTNKIFCNVQDDIDCACFKCCMVDIKYSENKRIYEVEEPRVGVFYVTYDKDNDTTLCSCKKFVRVGLLCAHIWLVLKNLKVESIPEQYIVARWTKRAMSKPVFKVTNEVVELCVVSHKRKSDLNQLISEFYSCVGLIGDDEEMMATMLKWLRENKKLITELKGEESLATSKRRLFENFYETPVAQVVTVLPPDPVKTKGSGSSKKSRKEKEIEHSKKPLRTCKKCKELTNHDSRNYPLNNYNNVTTSNDAT